ncbi:RNA polymerase sigma 70 [Streptomyces sp. CNQ-509]|uniref:sigma-70 family RNA polymerase sigma factor n=1 Tax=Streptomyces sp. CNQ-509 TaxID=444103 RepID=UPI00062DFA4D|nr:sigma-70 family RNA polymerase sigma factor [Streptomyces sp. CNQ-509]AKH85799.1 RNA polymerase sigma 70 [Streptomyces sp. CNQ-509]
MDEHEALLAEQFEEARDHLRAVAFRMLGSVTEADDAVQEAWLRLSRSREDGIRNLHGWLTTVVSRVCLDMLRARRRRREDLVESSVLAVGGGSDPVEQVLLADSVGLALLVVLESLEPAERLAFVLHDLFNVPFDEIAPIVERTPAAARKLASRARRRVRGGHLLSEPDLARRREVVEAFLSAARTGDFDSLISVLDPDVESRNNGVPRARGALAVAKGASSFAQIARFAQPALINASPGVIAAHAGQGVRVITFEMRDRMITVIDVITDPARLLALDMALLDG